MEVGGNLGQIRIVVLNLVIKAFAFDYADSILARRNRLFEEDYEWWETVTQWTILCVPCSFLAWYSLWLNYKEGLDSNLLNNIVSRYVPYVFRLPQGQLLFSPAMFKVSIIHFSITTSFLALAFPFHPWWSRNKNLLHYGWVGGWWCYSQKVITVKSSHDCTERRRRRTRAHLHFGV